MSSLPPVTRDGEISVLLPDVGHVGPPTIRDDLPSRDDLPAITARCGPAAAFAWNEFFSATIRNANTRKAYRNAVSQFCRWCETRRIELIRVTPGVVGDYFNGHRGSIPTKKLHLAALRSLFDLLVTRHVVILNPALSVRGERYQVLEGKTPEFTVEQVRTLLRSTPSSDIVGLRDRRSSPFSSTPRLASGRCASFVSVTSSTTGRSTVFASQKKVARCGRSRSGTTSNGF
jgi:hypothetical protein